MEVAISRFRAELKHWLERVRDGEEVIVTDHGTPLARVIGVERRPLMERLIREGVITPAKRPRQPASAHPRVKARGTVSDLISEQRD
jgi:prevent-host-death family protein